MKIVDGLQQFSGVTSIPAVTHLRVYSHEGTTVAVVGELTDNPGTSVTNAIERLLADLRQRYGPGVVVVEHYPAAPQLRPEPTWDTRGRRPR